LVHQTPKTSHKFKKWWLPIPVHLSLTRIKVLVDFSVDLFSGAILLATVSNHQHKINWSLRFNRWWVQSSHQMKRNRGFRKSLRMELKLSSKGSMIWHQRLWKRQIVILKFMNEPWAKILALKLQKMTKKDCFILCIFFAKKWTSPKSVICLVMGPRLVLSINRTSIRLIFMRRKLFWICILMSRKKKEMLKLHRKSNMSFLLAFIILLEARLSLFILHFKKIKSLR